MNWERGQIDYLGVDSFDNILRKIDTVISKENNDVVSPEAMVEPQVQPMPLRAEVYYVFMIIKIICQLIKLPFNLWVYSKKNLPFVRLKIEMYWMYRSKTSERNLPWEINLICNFVRLCFNKNKKHDIKKHKKHSKNIKT